MKRKDSSFFEKKEAKKLLQIGGRNLIRNGLGTPICKSFLLLFFKKEVFLTFFLSCAAQAQEVVRLPLAESKFPISAAVTVRAGSDMVFLSGALPSPVNKDAPKGSTAVFGGGTAVQTASALANIKSTLARMGMGMGDIIKMTVFLAGDPALGGRMDFPGLMEGYTKYFGTPDQPNLPARSAVQVAALAAPGALVEIEVIAVKPR